jgi:hypothetical protein
MDTVHNTPLRHHIILVLQSAITFGAMTTIWRYLPFFGTFKVATNTNFSVVPNVIHELKDRVPSLVVYNNIKYIMYLHAGEYYVQSPWLKLAGGRMPKINWTCWLYAGITATLCWAIHWTEPYKYVIAWRTIVNNSQDYQRICSTQDKQSNWDPPMHITQTTSAIFRMIPNCIHKHLPYLPKWNTSLLSLFSELKNW